MHNGQIRQMSNHTPAIQNVTSAGKSVVLCNIANGVFASPEAELSVSDSLEMGKIIMTTYNTIPRRYRLDVKNHG